jgi:arylsulfatase
VTVLTDGVAIGSGRVEHTEPIGFGAVYSDVGRDAIAQVTDEYPRRGNGFTGTITWVELEAGTDSHDHLINPDDFIRLAMAKQ